MSVVNQKHRREEAEAKAKQAQATGPVGYISDAWGGYWQCQTVYGPWTFRLADDARAVPPQDVKSS